METNSQKATGEIDQDTKEIIFSPEELGDENLDIDPLLDKLSGYGSIGDEIASRLFEGLRETGMAKSEQDEWHSCTSDNSDDDELSQTEYLPYESVNNMDIHNEVYYGYISLKNGRYDSVYSYGLGKKLECEQQENIPLNIPPAHSTQSFGKNEAVLLSRHLKSSARRHRCCYDSLDSLDSLDSIEIERPYSCCCYTGCSSYSLTGWDLNKYYSCDSDGDSSDSDEYEVESSVQSDEKADKETKSTCQDDTEIILEEKIQS
jgi:hypothetical protein